MWSSNTDTSSGGGFLDHSRRDEQDTVKSRRAQTIAPAMIAQLLSASSIDNIEIGGIPSSMFTIFGIVRNIEETATKISYDIEDDTGTISAMKWLEAHKKASGVTMKTNTYARIIGLLREQDDKRYLLILRIFPVQDLNELTNHILEVIYAKLKGKAMKKTQNEWLDQSESSEDSRYYGMTEDQTLIYKVIQAHNNTESGIERSEIKKQLPKRLLSGADKMLEHLVSEGHIYTTCTEDYFKTT